MSVEVEVSVTEIVISRVSGVVQLVLDMVTSEYVEELEDFTEEEKDIVFCWLCGLT